MLHVSPAFASHGVRVAVSAQPCISLAPCAAQMHSRFFRSLLRHPGHPYRSDVMVSKPSASKPRRARSPAAERRRNSAEGNPSTPEPAQPSDTADQPAEQTQPAASLAKGTPESAALEAWFNNLSPAERQCLMQTQSLSASALTSVANTKTTAKQSYCCAIAALKPWSSKYKHQ